MFKKEKSFRNNFSGNKAGNFSFIIRELGMVLLAGNYENVCQLSVNRERIYLLSVNREQEPSLTHPPYKPVLSDFP